MHDCLFFGLSTMFGIKAKDEIKLSGFRDSTVPSTWEVSSIVSMGVTLESQIDTPRQDSNISICI